MKKITKVLSLIAAAIFAVACFEVEPNTASSSFSSADDSLEGEVVTEANTGSVYYKMFVLNEGQMGKNNASLDFLRYTTGKYTRGAFAKMNPSVTMGLGDTANDIKFYYNTAWVCMTGSGIVQIFYATDEKVTKTLEIPGCRKIAFGLNGYAYVTSYNGAVYGGDEIKGRLYRVNLNTLSTDYIEVGFQPEGVAVSNGYVYVLNSGGYMPGYGNTMSVISEASFSVIKEVEVVNNPKDIVVDNNGDLWITSPGDYYSTHSGLYLYNSGSFKQVDLYPDLKNVRVSCSYSIANYIFAIGTEDEWNWSGPTDYNVYLVNCADHKVTVRPFKGEMNNIKVPYAIAYNPYSAETYISDAGDYVNPGMVYCFGTDMEFKWKTTAGVNPGKLDFYYIYQGSY